MILLLLILTLLLPVSAQAVGQLTQAANPPEPIYVLSQSAIPFIKASSGTMGNNCAISALTALSRTYSSGAYIWLPAGAIAAGVPAAADWYWFVGSSTTAGTCYNQTYSNNKDAVGTPRIPASNTAFSTTGPGAFTGDTGTAIGQSITLPAKSMGPNGRVEILSHQTFTNSGGNKTINVRFGTNSCFDVTYTTHVSGTQICSFSNRGVANVQAIGWVGVATASATGTAAATDGSTDTAAAVTISFRLTATTATDNATFESYRILVIPGN
jgi:hypothetical protein